MYFDIELEFYRKRFISKFQRSRSLILNLLIKMETISLQKFNTLQFESSVESKLKKKSTLIIIFHLIGLRYRIVRLGLGSFIKASYLQFGNFTFKDSIKCRQSKSNMYIILRCLINCFATLSQKVIHSCIILLFLERTCCGIILDSISC